MRPNGSIGWVQDPRRALHAGVAALRRRWTAADWAVVGYAVAIAVLIAARAPFIPEWPVLLAIHLTLVATLAALPPRGAAWERPDAGESAAARRARATLRFLRYSYPLPLAAFFFEEVRFFVNALFPRSPYWFEPWLYAADRSLFGSLPAVALNAWVSPWLTEIMQALYFSYYPILIAAVVLAWRRPETGRPSAAARRDGEAPSGVPRGRPGGRAAATPGPGFDATITSIAFSYVLVFLPYPWLPARGPWENPELMAGLRSLEGYVFTPLMDWIIGTAAVPGGCFPSAHVAGAWGAVLGLAFGLHGRQRRWAWVLMALTAAMSFACVYTRYHHAVDIVAGVPVGVVGALLGRRAARRVDRPSTPPPAGDPE